MINALLILQPAGVGHRHTSHHLINDVGFDADRIGTNDPSLSLREENYI